MGHSPTIQEMQKQEDDYRQYIQKLENELRERSSSYEKDQQNKIDKYYKDSNWDMVNFISGKNVDFLHEKEWSLDNLKKILDLVSKAMFGATTPPEGVKIEKPEEVGKAIQKMANLELYIVGQAFEVITGILDAFGSKESLSFNASSQVKPIAPGITLFATVVADSYKSTSFFSNEVIYQYYYIYEVKYSAKQALSEQGMEDIQMYANILEGFREKLESFADQLENGQIDEDVFEEKTEKYTKFIDDYEAMIAKLGG
jgi:hypothetical protein